MSPPNCIEIPSEQSLGLAAGMAAKHLEGNDREFFQRVWATPLERYRNRLQAIGFARKREVLDAGSGMGQWSVALATLNLRVTSVEFAHDRVRACRTLFKELNLTNTRLVRASVTSSVLPSATFDAIFCYSVIMLTDYRATLREFHRLLKPGGSLYLNANGLGYYLKLIIEQPNRSSSYDPRNMASEVLSRSFGYMTGLGAKPEGQILIPSKLMRQTLHESGFRGIRIGSEGSLRIGKASAPVPFYDPHYLGQETVYEVLARKM